MMSEKGELYINAGALVFASAEVRGYAHAAYSPASNLAVITGVYGPDFGPPAFKGALGFYTAGQKSGKKHATIWEIYTGIKIPLQNLYHQGPNIVTNRDLFFETTVGLKHTVYELGFTARLVNAQLPDPLSLTFFEPSLTFKIGYKWVKLIIFGGGSLLLDQSPQNYEDNYIYSPLYLSAGLQFDLLDAYAKDNSRNVAESKAF